MIYSFANDYSECAHPKVLKALLNNKTKQNVGYGLDDCTKKVEKLLKKMVKKPKAAIHLLPGGTLTNLTFIASTLKPYEAVIAAQTGHINVHETGAIEASGHKIVTAKTIDGKLRPQDVEDLVLYHCDEHMVKPKLVFISNATEVGTIYNKSDLQALRSICDKYNLYLYLDGARLANALVCNENDLSLEDIASLTDAFYLGGTKNGLLFGEALIIINQKLNENFRYMIKQRGGLTAKGFVTAIQFETLLKNDLYLELAKNANDCAQLLKAGLIKKGVKMAYDSPTNQIFAILPDSLIDKLKTDYRFEVSNKIDNDKHVVRFVCSWATKEENVTEFLSKL